jgi:hypothetical protein
LQNPNQFNPLEIGRYSVIRVHWEFYPNPPQAKLFVVLRHARMKSEHGCLCIRATSKTAHYESNTERMQGAVLYQAKELVFFPKKTIIAPENRITILHSHMQKESLKSHYKVEGKMPDDFHDRLVKAINHNVLLEPKAAQELLEHIRR